MHPGGHASSLQVRGQHRDLGDILFADDGRPIPESDWVALVRATAAGDPRALQALYRRTHRVVFTLVMRLCRNRETAEELTVDVFHDVWRRAGDYDPANGSVMGWVMNQARSRAIDRLRFEHRKKRVDPSPDRPDDAAPIIDPERALEAEQQDARVRAALETLKPEEREALELAFFSGLTHAETAARLGWPLGTVKGRIRAALTKLRDALGSLHP